MIVDEIRFEDFQEQLKSYINSGAFLVFCSDDKMDFLESIDETENEDND